MTFAIRNNPEWKITIAGFQALKGRVLSASRSPHADDPRYATMLDELLTMFSQYQKDGTVRIEYDTKILYGQLSAQVRCEIRRLICCDDWSQRSAGFVVAGLLQNGFGSYKLHQRNTRSLPTQAKIAGFSESAEARFALRSCCRDFAKHPVAAS